MIFRPEMAKLIKQGKKSQTRRVSETCRYRLGHSYALQPGRGKSAVGRITVTGVRRERLGDISLKDAKREGFVTTEEFFDYWKSLHRKVDRDLLVWVISFSLGDQTDTAMLLSRRLGTSQGDYVSEDQAYLGAVDAGIVVPRAAQERFSREAFARDDAMRRERITTATDRIGKELASLRTDLAGGPDRREKRAIESIQRTTGALKRCA